MPFWLQNVALFTVLQVIAYMEFIDSVKHMYMTQPKFICSSGHVLNFRGEVCPKLVWDYRLSDPKHVCLYVFLASMAGVAFLICI